MISKKRKNDEDKMARRKIKEKGGGNNLFLLIYILFANDYIDYMDKKRIEKSSEEERN